MHDTISPNVLKARFSRKVIQIKALATMIENMNNKKQDKQIQTCSVDRSRQNYG